jgi:hypothetical protein
MHRCACWATEHLTRNIGEKSFIKESILKKYVASDQREANKELGYREHLSHGVRNKKSKEGVRQAKKHHSLSMLMHCK